MNYSANDLKHARLSSLTAPAADDNRVAKGLRRGGRAGTRVGRSGGGVRTSDGCDCAAPVRAHCPLKTMAVEPRLLPFR